MLWEVDIHPAPSQPDRAAQRLAEAAPRSRCRQRAHRGDRPRVPDPGRPHRSGRRPADRRRAAGRPRGRADGGRPGGRRRAAAGSGSPERRRSGDAGPRAAQAGRDGPGGPERRGGDRRLRHRAADAVRTLQQVLDRRPDRRGDGPAGRRQAAGQRRDRAGRSSGRWRSTTSKSARRYQFELGTCRSPGSTTTALVRLSREGQLYLPLAEMQTIQRLLPPTWAATRPTSNWKRSPRPGASTAATRRWPGGFATATRTASGSSRTCSRRRSSPPRSEIRRRLGRRRLVRQRVRGQRRRRPLRRRVQRRLQGRDAQSSLGPGALRRRQHGHRRRDPRPAGHRPGRQADLQHRRLLLRPARHAGRATCRRACCIRAA